MSNSFIRSLQPYQPGKPIAELAREKGVSPDKIIKLASNENPYGPSELVTRTLSSELSDLARYPDGGPFLRQELAHFYSLNYDQITLGSGSSNILAMLVHVYVSQGDEVLFSQYAFASYGILAQSVGAIPVAAPAKNWACDPDAIISSITDKTRIIFIANPNNPTGSWLNASTLKRFLQKVPEDIIVVIDEAYGEFVTQPEYQSAISWLDDFKNLVVTRTFSKIYGLAGLQVGYGMSHPEVADLLNRVRHPFNVNSMALSAARLALSDQRHVSHCREMNGAGRSVLQQGLDRLQLDYLPTATNFITFRSPVDGLVIFKKLLEKLVIIRPLTGYGMPFHLRVTIGSEPENEQFLKSLACVIK